MVIRRGGRQDVRFLRDMLHHAYYWRERSPGEEPGPVARYVKGWGRPGDTALIAVEDGFPVGAAWYRLFRREHPGYGVVDEETPELAIAAVPSRRGDRLGGGPAGYTAAIRAAQLGARVVCIEKESELGGTCLRVGCIPTKAWAQTAHALHAAREIDPKLGVVAGEPRLDFGVANEWKAAVVKQMTSGVASLFKANGVTALQGVGRFESANTIAFEHGEGVSFKSAI